MSEHNEEVANSGKPPEAVAKEVEAPSSIADSGQAARRVAVVGVHGIARHPAGETMNAMANLLMSLPKEKDISQCASGKYEPFKAVGIQIPLRPVCLGEKSQITKKTTKYSLEEESAKFASYLEPKASPRQERKVEAAQWAMQADKGGSKTGNTYTRVLLEGYQGGADTNVYVTTKLEGERKAAGKKPATKVDIYEVLWADLAHPETSVVGFFLSLFTLLFHLGSLSRLALDSASGEQTGPLWKTFLFVQRWAVRVLQIFLPLLKVLVLVAIFSAMPSVSQQLNGNHLFAIALGALGGTGAGFLIFKSTRWKFGRSPWLWALVVLGPTVVGAVAIWLGLWLKVDSNVIASLECWIVVGGLILYFVLSKYESYRNGVQVTGRAGFGLSVAGYVGLLIYSGWNVPLASFWVLEFLVAAIRISWLGMSALAIVALILGWMVCLPAGVGDSRARLRAAVRTSRLALALPAVSFLLVTPLIWAALFKIGDAINHPYFHLNSWDNKDIGGAAKWMTEWDLIPDISLNTVRDDYLHALMGWAMGYQLPITLGFVVVAFFLLLWWALPSALLERFRQRSKQIPPRSSTNVETMGLGVWLSRGLDATTVVTALLWSALFVAFPAVYLLDFFPAGWLYGNDVARGVDELTKFTEFLVTSILTGVSFAALISIVKYGSSVLEMILDVDTYLRTSPEDASPRAKIFERFVSTLRYLAQYRDEKGEGYDSVVIVAHSLGSLITADLLRFLKKQGCDPELARFGFGIPREPEPKSAPKEIKLHLLTMGSPIRQLLNRFFPHLYDWVRSSPDNGLEPLPAAAETAPPKVSSPWSPAPAELGVDQWINVYRSGDYVGRSLWLDEWYNRTNPAVAGTGRYPQKIYKHSLVAGSVQEMCIGAGAHTHYWDDTAPDVAEVLDGMI